MFGHVNYVLFASLGFHTTTRPAFISSLLATMSLIVSSSFRMSIVSTSLHVRGRTGLARDSWALLPCAEPSPPFDTPTFVKDVKQLPRLAPGMSSIYFGQHRPAPLGSILTFNVPSGASVHANPRPAPTGVRRQQAAGGWRVRHRLIRKISPLRRGARQWLARTIPDGEPTPCAPAHGVMRP